MTVIVGFDISSSCTGYAALQISNDKISLIDCGFYQPKKTGNIIEELALTRTDIKALIEKYKPDHIAIEQLIEFMKGHSQSKTIIKLASYNRMISLLAYDYLGKPPNLYSVLAIRHGIKFSKQLPSKEDIPEIVAKHLNIEFPYIYKKKNKSIDKKTNDIADAIAVGIYHCFILTGKIIKKKKK